MSKRIVWHVETWNISDLKPHPKNPRIITEERLDQMGESFDDIGVAQMININVDGTILSGHARYLQLKREGVERTEVLVPDRKLTPKQEEAVIIRMNKTIVGEWDFDKLANEWELSDLIDFGFTENELHLDNHDFEIDDKQNKDDDEQTKKYLIEVQFPNEMEMMDIYDDLVHRGYIARVKK